MKEHYLGKSIIPWHRKNKIEAQERIPYDAYFVIVDDEPVFRDATQRELNVILEQFPNQKFGVATPQNIKEALQLVMKGNQRREADVVLVDHSLDHENDRWKWDEWQVTSWARKLGIQFPITHSGRRVPEDIIGKNLTFYHPTGADIALLLRMAGFQGAISILSNSGRHIIKSYDLSSIYEAIPDIVLKDPIYDRVLPKIGFAPPQVFGNSLISFLR